MAPIREIVMEDDSDQVELKVTFYPELYLQRRIWILDILRRDNIAKLLDIGCGEGELLGTLCQPAPWLTPPPYDVLPPETPKTPIASPTFNSEDDIPNLHATLIHGLDISEDDLAFAINTTQPPQPMDQFKDAVPLSPHPQKRFNTTLTRFEDLEVKLWKGGLEMINEEFVGIECIVSTEVIEHLPPSIFPFFAPIILGVYHPERFLMTTPSYTFNARFTSPDALPSVRKGYPDPTKRTDRIFRHSDHKFEWTTEEFESWRDETASTWGYSVHWSSIGHAREDDPYGRDEELGGATFVAEFRKLGAETMTDAQREKLGRETVEKLMATEDSAIHRTPHELVAHHRHLAHPSSQKPKPFEEIAKIVKERMEEYREAFMRLDELWFESEISTACGGWIEFLVKAVEESPVLHLKKEEDGIKRKRDMWTVEIIGAKSLKLWGDPDDVETETNQSTEYVPPDWTPGEGWLESTDMSDLGESTGAEGDISLCGSEEDSAWSPNVVPGKGWPIRKPKRRNTWQPSSTLKNSDEQDSDDAWSRGWGSSQAWVDSSEDEKRYKRPGNSSTATAAGKKTERDGNTSTAGWDGDADDSDTE
ncbi:hypothetical protein CC1G_06330 [Coprinopsis cinerea okayama7|uniref:Small RNA 2'-O-methyltransferase n=1 Tax=Coprinopsis cinerea (strain Okayama-7 / 130 / ATCC MYA-4618 / FGSC 9003) TaxID=240176 RepID=A8NTJ5_COPC7|nr:hypothetical protein CC1G_06330 [Coprinopsis cinerea okayama7\|eukprot:XP_001836245.1 hypothetical protein CC1G_06330 [Coprinopsis cinerea okayama7\